MMNLSRRTAAVCLLAVGAIQPAAAQVVPLKPVSAFSTISDEHARSVALFVEAARVITSPRCMNCHPSTRQPTQGDDLHAHVPLMYGGPHDRGVPGLPCRSCHGTANTPTLTSSIASIPGNPNWGLAPASMAWQGKSVREICLQVKDGARNGGRSLSKIHEHVATDPLVGWAWHPGEGRVPAPGTQTQFGALIRAWISTGARCPEYWRDVDDAGTARDDRAGEASGGVGHTRYVVDALLGSRLDLSTSGVDDGEPAGHARRWRQRWMPGRVRRPRGRTRDTTRIGGNAAVQHPSDSDGDAPVLGCGGSIELLVERLTPDHITLLEELASASQRDESSLLACVVKRVGQSLSVTREWLRNADARELRSRHATVDADTDVLLQYVPPMIRLLIFGAGDDARPLCDMGSSLGWHVSVADRRGRLATRARFPNADAVVAAEWEDAVTALESSPRTAAVLMTHSLEDDARVLSLLSGRSLSYIGALGPAHRLQWLLEEVAVGARLTDDVRLKVRGPIGLDLGDRSATGIAVAVAAEILAQLNARDAQPLHARADRPAVERRPGGCLVA